MGHNSISGSIQETLYHYFDTGTVHDECVLYLYMYCPRRIGTFARDFLQRWYSVCSDRCCLVLRLAGQAENKKIIRMKTIKRSTGVALAFLIYVSVTAAYLLPRNTEVSQTEKYLTVAGSYVIVLLLWLCLLYTSRCV